MREVKLRRVAGIARKYLVARVSKGTGNLAYNSVHTRHEGAGRAVIYIDEAVAPRMLYVNEPRLHRHSNKNKNPNEGWFDEAANGAAAQIVRVLGGKMKG